MNPNNPWFRVYTEAVDDEKLRLLAFEDRWHFIALLCCKGKGIIDEPNKDLMRRKVAVKLGLDPRALDEVARRLAEVGLIDEHTLQPLAWNSRQFGSDSDPTNAERQKRWRERKKEQADGSTTLRNGPVTPKKRLQEEEADTDTEAETEVSQKRKEAPQASRASPPIAPVAPVIEATAKATKPTAPKPVKSPIPQDWTPAETTYALLEKHGIPRPFAEGCIDEFRLYWQERGESRAGWESTFVNNAQRQWEHRPQPAPTPRNGPSRPFLSKQDRIAAQNETAIAEWLASRRHETHVLEGECHEIH